MIDVGEEASDLARCTKQFAQSVRRNVKFLSSPQATDLFTAKTVT